MVETRSSSKNNEPSTPVRRPPSPSLESIGVTPKRRMPGPNDDDVEIGRLAAADLPDRTVIAVRRHGVDVDEDTKKVLEIISSAWNMNYVRNSIQMEITETFLGCIEYQGLNVPLLRKKIANGLMAACNGKKRAVHIALIKLIALHIVRGNNIRNILQTIDPLVGDQFRQWFTAIPVAATLDKNDRKTSCTLSRISLCFPELTFEVSFHVVMPNITRLEKFQLVPQQLRCSSFAALIDPTVTGAEYDVMCKCLKTYIMYHAVCSRVYARKSATDPLTKVELQRQREFANIMTDQSLVPFAKRTSLVLSASWIDKEVNEDGSYYFTIPTALNTLASEFDSIMA